MNDQLAIDLITAKLRAMRHIVHRMGTHYEAYVRLTLVFEELRLARSESEAKKALVAVAALAARALADIDPDPPPVPEVADPPSASPAAPQVVGNCEKCHQPAERLFHHYYRVFERGAPPQGPLAMVCPKCRERAS